jgi:4-hydroxybenzoate polyprenyltransferase
MVKDYLDLCRVSNLPTVWTNVLAALVLSGPGFSWSSYLILGLSMSLFYSGGMCLNDMCDLAPDRTKKPFRPLPSGRISLRSAAVFTGSLFGLALLLLLLVPFPGAILAGCALLVVITAYDVLHKAHPLTVILMAGCRFLIFVVVGIAVVGFPNSAVMTAGVAQFAWVVVISVVARYENTLAMPFSMPLIPAMIAAISLLDGLLMAFFATPAWLAAGVAGAVLTRYGQRFVRGD